MPTIDQLAPATAVSDSDELLVSQSGIARKATRIQILAGVQPQLAIISGTLLGRSSSGIGAAEQIAIGANLSMANGVLSANASPFSIASLTAGLVPASNDLVPLGQDGNNTAVSYGQFMSGLAGLTNVDISRLLVTPTSGGAPIKLADLAANTLALGGGTLTGVLTLASDPSASLQAATKQYVDAQVATALPKAGGTITGPLTLAASPTGALQAATKQYVDTQIAGTLLKSGGALTGALTLAADPTTALQAATKQYVDKRVLRTGDTLTGPLVLAADPTSALQAATKGYVDTQVATALPKAGGALTGALTLAADPSASLQAATKQYVDARVATALPAAGGRLTGPLTLAADPVNALDAATRQYVDTRVLRTGDALTGPLVLAADPTTALQAATKGYVDTQVAGALPKSGGTLTGALTLAADPTLSMQAATRHYVDTQVATSLPLSGGTLSGPLTLPINPISGLQAAPKQYVDAQFASALPLAGGTLNGPLTLAGDPTSSLQAATKRYVDTASGAATGVINVRSAPYNARLDGVTDDTAAFKAAYQAAIAGSVIYVPNGITVVQPPTSWGVPLTKRVKWIVDGTSLLDGTSLADAIPGGTGPAGNYLPGFVVGNSNVSVEVSQNGSQPTDFAVSHSSYIVNHTGGPNTGAVSANTRNDTIIYNSPANFVWGGVDRLLWCGSQVPSGSTTAEHVGRYVQTIRQNYTLDSSSKPLPQPNLWATCLEYRDTTGQPSSMVASSITAEMDWFGNGPDDANLRQIQSLVVGQHNTAGLPVEVSTVIGVYLAAGSTGHVYRVLSVGIPFSTAVLDTTNAVQLAGAAAIRMAAGHAIAFEPTNTCRLAYDATTNTLRWYQGTFSYPVGKGIAVGWFNVYAANATLPNYISGNMIFLVGSDAAYTITLPPAASVASGTGYTFSVLGSAPVTIVTCGSDSIDNGPITLRTNDRYHVVSDATSAWREIFRTNAVSPRFSGPPALPSYSVATLPASPGAGSLAFATMAASRAKGSEPEPVSRCSMTAAVGSVPAAAPRSPPDRRSAMHETAAV
jgi:hypothetical protein